MKILLIAFLSLAGASAFAITTGCAEAINKVTESSIVYGQGLKIENNVLVNVQGEKSLSDAVENATKLCETSIACVEAINSVSESSIVYGQGLKLENNEFVNIRGEKSLGEAVEKATNICK